MAKYSYEFKKKVVMEYLEGGGSYVFVSKKNGIPHDTSLVAWVAAYRALGDDGLKNSLTNVEYSLDFKLRMVELYLSTDVTQQELSLKYGMSSTAIRKWIKAFKDHGTDGLKSQRERLYFEMKKSKHDNPSKDGKSGNDSEYLKKLEEENLHLRIENAYLKELRRLRQEEKLQKKQRESSTASEENSD